MFGGEFIAFGDPGPAGWTAADLATFPQELRSRRPVDRTVHSPAAQQRFVRRVDNRIDPLLGDIALNDFESASQSAFRGAHLRLLSKGAAILPPHGRSGKLRDAGFRPEFPAIRPVVGRAG